jgi:hypothetical protein
MFFFHALLGCKAMFYFLSLKIYVYNLVVISRNTSMTVDQPSHDLNIFQLAKSLIKLLLHWPPAV